MDRQRYQTPALPPTDEAALDSPQGAARYIVRLRAALQKILSDMNARITTLETRGMRDRLFPVGSVYEMENGKNPQGSIGGKWEMLEAGERSTKWRRM